MMEFKEFKDTVVSRIEEFLPPSFSQYKPFVEEINKVNEKKIALILKSKNGEIEPGVALPIAYLDDAYVYYKACLDIEMTLMSIAMVFIKYMGVLTVSEEDLDFTNKKDKIVMNLISKEQNETLLKQVPWIEFLDMAIVFRVVMRINSEGFDTVLLNKSIFSSMKIEMEELSELAYENTKRMFAPTIKDMGEFLIITNIAEIQGATSVLFPEICQKASEILGRDYFYLVPSSIHEMLAVSPDYDLGELLDVLKKGNRDVTEKSEVLSKTIYSYDRNYGNLSKEASYQ